MTTVTVLVGPDIKKDKVEQHWNRLTNIFDNVEFRAIRQNEDGSFIYPRLIRDENTGNYNVDANDLELNAQSHVVLEAHGLPVDRNAPERGQTIRVYNEHSTTVISTNEALADIADKIRGNRIILNSCYAGLAVRSIMQNNTELHGCNLLASTADDTPITECYTPLLEVATKYFGMDNVANGTEFFADERVKSYPGELSLITGGIDDLQALRRKSLIPLNTEATTVALEYQRWQDEEFVDHAELNENLNINTIFNNRYFNHFPKQNWLIRLLEEYTVAREERQQDLLPIIAQKIDELSDDELFDKINNGDVPTLAECLFYHLSSFDNANELLTSVVTRLRGQVNQPADEIPEHYPDLYKKFLLFSCTHANAYMINQITSQFEAEFAQEFKTIQDPYHNNLLKLLAFGGTKGGDLEFRPETPHRIRNAYDALTEKIHQATPNGCLPRNTAYKAAMHQLIEGVNVNAGENAFHSAAQSDNAYVFEKMYSLNKEAALVESAGGHTPLTLSVTGNCQHVLAFLLSQVNGDHLNQRFQRTTTVGDVLFTALDLALMEPYDSQTLRTLLNSQRFVRKFQYFNTVNNLLGGTPLTTAINKRLPDAVEDLARCKKVDLQRQNSNQELPIHEVFAIGNINILNRFLAGARGRKIGWDKKGREGNNILFYAIDFAPPSVNEQDENLDMINAIFNHVDYPIFKTSKVKQLMKEPNNLGMLPIHYASSKGSLQSLGILLNNGAKINSKTTEEIGPFGKLTPLTMAIKELQFDTVEFLSDCEGININGTKGTEPPLAVALAILVNGTDLSRSAESTLNEDQINGLLTIINNLIGKDGIDAHKKSPLLDNYNIHEFIHGINEGHITPHSELSAAQSNRLSDISEQVRPAAAGACCWGVNCTACLHQGAHVQQPAM